MKPLQSFRSRFALRPGLIYLDGNSLGALPKETASRLMRTVESEWGEGLITSWLGAAWAGAPLRIGDKIARLVGAGAGEVVAADSTSINIFKAVAAALSLRPGRTVLLSESGNFPTDVYMMQGIAAFSGGRITVRTVPPDEVEAALAPDVAAVLLTQVQYKSGRLRDMDSVTRCAHAAGALTVWDLSHSAGAVPVDLNGAGADFAVGCGYKFLNGGPGAPGFLFAARRHHGALPVLSGWFGHASPFDFAEEYKPAAGIARFLCGTPPVLGLAALECGVDMMLEADMGHVRRASIELAEMFIDLMEPLCAAFGFVLITPREARLRASQVAYTHPNGYEMIQALKARDVIADFRAPDVLRFGLTPLYVTLEDVAEAVRRLDEICRSRAWDRAAYRTRAAIT